MKKYVLIFKTSIRTALERSVLITKLYQLSKEIINATVDLDDEEFILRIEAENLNKHLIIQALQQEGYEVDFLAAYAQNEIGAPLLQN